MGRELSFWLGPVSWAKASAHFSAKDIGPIFGTRGWAAFRPKISDRLLGCEQVPLFRPRPWPSFRARVSAHFSTRPSLFRWPGLLCVSAQAVSVWARFLGVGGQWVRSCLSVHLCVERFGMRLGRRGYIHHFHWFHVQLVFAIVLPFVSRVCHHGTHGNG